MVYSPLPEADEDVVEVVEQAAPAAAVDEDDETEA